MSTALTAAATSATPFSSVPTDRLWLYHKRWDLTFLIGSAVLGMVPLILLYWFNVSTTAINLLVAGIVGGPHLYSTFGYTLADRNYRKRYGWVLLPTLLIPVGVVYLALNNLVLLLTIFFFWASVHVLHQIAYITDAYRFKDPRPRSFWNRAIDYGVIFTGLYVTSTPRLVNREFVVGGGTSPRSLLLPEWAFGAQWIPWLVTGVFLVFLTLYVVKTVREARQGRLNVPSVAIISVTTVMSLIIPMFPNIDIAFQGYNTWHSFQYLALVWYINKLRLEQNQIGGPVMRSVSGPGRAWRFYGLFLLATIAAFGMTLLLQHGFGWERDAAYYGVVLGTLLVHYYLDGLNFFNWGLVTEPSPGDLARMSAPVTEAAA
ncbi:MAG: hypothetical protein ACREOU_05625 [Candidatus Eiseniibacteriota bacterium]